MIKYYIWSFFALLSVHLSAERGPSFPFITGDTFRCCADFIYDETGVTLIPETVKPGDIIFVKADCLGEFFERSHSRIANPYILITHNSDNAVPGAFASYLDDVKLIAWFGQNVENFSHPKLHPIPIGIANRRWEHGNIEIFKELTSLCPKGNKSILLYMNFEIGTRPDERSYVYSLFCNSQYCVKSRMKSISEYLFDMTQTKFVLSPRGNGLDCHRTWEALLMGAIPIVRTSANDSVYEGLPVLIIDDWSIIDAEYLEDQYQKMQAKNYVPERAYANYWITKIQSYKQNIEKDRHDYTK